MVCRRLKQWLHPLVPFRTIDVLVVTVLDGCLFVSATSRSGFLTCPTKVRGLSGLSLVCCNVKALLERTRTSKNSSYTILHCMFQSPPNSVIFPIRAWCTPWQYAQQGHSRMCVAPLKGSCVVNVGLRKCALADGVSLHAQVQSLPGRTFIVYKFGFSHLFPRWC